MARDWLSTLWPASFKGVPFEVEKDDFEGGRRIASHEFAHRDDPLHEDLGSAVARWEVTAYVASDAADGEAAALIAVLDTAGAGPLVLPIDGPAQARAHKWRRLREKDRAGYIAVSVTFLREGATWTSSTIDGLAQAVFDVVDGLGGVLDALAGVLTLPALAEWVGDAVVSGLVDTVAALDVAAGVLLDGQAIASATTQALSALVTVIEDEQDPATATGLVATLAALGIAAPADGTTAAAVMLALGRSIADAAIEADATDGPSRVVEAFADLISGDADSAPATAATATRLAMSRNAVVIDASARLVALAVTAEAIVRTDYASRRDGVAARAGFVVAVDRALAPLASLGAAEVADAVAAVVALRSATVAWLTRAIADLAPVRTVRNAAELPAVVVAWRLWADPTRAGELVARNRVTHPGFMPQIFEALVE